MRYILKSKSFDRRGQGEKLYCIIAGSAVYEVANSLTRLIRANLFPKQEVDIAWQSLSQLTIVYHRLSFGSRAVDIALTLERQSAYDAAYLTLAESLSAELWTLDGPLYRNAINYGFSVRLLQ